MGHDISAYKVDDKEQENEIAYLRRNAFSPLNRAIYDLLNCQQNYCRFSGCGVSQVFSMNAITKALQDLPKDEEYEPERTFLQDCIKKSDGDVLISFW